MYIFVKLRSVLIKYNSTQEIWRPCTHASQPRERRTSNTELLYIHPSQTHQQNSSSSPQSLYTMSSSPVPSRSAADTTPIPDDEEQEPDLPLTMTASIVLTSLPHDARAGLATAGAFEKEKGTPLPRNISIRLQSKSLTRSDNRSSHILQSSRLSAHPQKARLDRHRYAALRSRRNVPAAHPQVQARR